MALIARDASLGPITGNPGAQFDPTKFSWLGTTATETNVCIAHKNAAVKTVQDLLTTEVTVGDNGAGTGTGNYPKALNQLLGLKFKIVRGYVSSADVVLAMERGEVDGYCESLESVYRQAAGLDLRARPSMCCFRAACGRIPISRTCLSSTIWRRRRTTGAPSNSSMPGRGSDDRSSRRRDWRRTC